MFCRTKIRANYNNSKQVEEVMTLLDCHKPLYAPGTENHIGFEKHIENLSFKFFPETKSVNCVNSLHKFKHGTNSNLFTRSEIEETINLIAEILKIPERQLYFYSVETAVNLTGLKHATATYLFQPISYKGKLFYQAEPPRGTNKILERYCRLTDKNIKFYNQRGWLNYLDRCDIGHDQLRYEHVYYKAKPIQYLLNCSLLPAPLLYSKDIISQFGAGMLKTYQTIDKVPHVDYSQFKPQEIALLAAGASRDINFWELMKLYPESKHKYRSEYLRLKKRAGASDELAIEIEEKIKEQIELIIEG